MKGFSIIVAFDEGRGIGKGGLLPWHLPSDLKHFKEITGKKQGALKNVVIMGRKTWESIPEKFRPLPDRLNVVVSTQSGYVLPSGVNRSCSLEEAFDAYINKDYGEVFVIGGAKVFSDAIKHPLCERLYLTLIHGQNQADVFFPDIPTDFRKVSISKNMQENGKTFSFLEMNRDISAIYLF